VIFYHCWIETKSPGAGWQRYELFMEETDPPGVYVADEAMCDGVDDLAQRVLGDYLESVLSTHADQPDVRVRTRAQAGDRTSGGPSAICEASPDDITGARQRLQRYALTDRLRSACRGIYEARRGLEAAVVKAHDEGLNRHTITRAVASHLDAQSVARLIDAHVLTGEVWDLICTRPELAGRILVRNRGRYGVDVELRWTEEEHDAEQLRWGGWSETLEEYDRELAAALLSTAQSAAGDLLALLSPRFDVAPTTPQALAPEALVYHPVTVQRHATQSAADNSAEGALA
jgi:hypothetical protein